MLQYFGRGQEKGLGVDVNNNGGIIGKGLRACFQNRGDFPYDMIAMEEFKLMV